MMRLARRPLVAEMSKTMEVPLDAVEELGARAAAAGDEGGDAGVLELVEASTSLRSASSLATASSCAGVPAMQGSSYYLRTCLRGSVARRAHRARRGALVRALRLRRCEPAAHRRRGRPPQEHALSPLHQQARD